MNMFQKIEFLTVTTFVFADNGNFSQILFLKTTIMIKIITTKIKLPPSKI